MRPFFLLALLAPLAAAAPASAQTAEEAVAYAFLGLSDGGTIARATTTMAWKEAGPSPAVFDGDVSIEGHPAKLRFTVAAEDPCHYEITLEGPPNVVPGSKRLYARVALDHVTAVALIDGGIRASVTGSGFCETGHTNRDCMGMPNPDLFAAVDATRHAAAVAFLLAKVCAPGTQ